MIDTGAGVLLANRRGDPVKCKARVVDQSRRKDVSFADHRVLTAARNVVAKSGHERKTRPGERLEQSPIAETVTEGPARAGIEKVIDAGVKVIVAIALHGR